MKSDGLCAGRLSRKPHHVRCFERLGAPMVSDTSCFTKLLRFVGVRRRCFDASNERTPRGVCEMDPPQTPFGAVFAADRAPKSQTALKS